MLEDDHDQSVAIDLPPDSAGRKRISIYQPETAGQIFPELPEFANHAEERAYRKQHLVAACRAFAMHGFDYGFAGHLTVRDPERQELLAQYLARVDMMGIADSRVSACL